MGAMGVSLTGPYKSNGKQELPDADMTLKVEGMGPQPMTARIISTKDNAFVEYEGVTYEVGADKIAQLKAQSKSGKGTTPDVADAHGADEELVPGHEHAGGRGPRRRGRDPRDRPAWTSRRR